MLFKFPGALHVLYHSCVLRLTFPPAVADSLPTGAGRTERLEELFPALRRIPPTARLYYEGASTAVRLQKAVDKAVKLAAEATGLIHCPHEPSGLTAVRWMLERQRSQILKLQAVST